jgi:hypothetical protein
MEARRVEIQDAHRTHAHAGRNCNGSAIGDDVVVGDGGNDGTHGCPPLRVAQCERCEEDNNALRYRKALVPMVLTSGPLLRVAKLRNYSCKLEIYRQKALLAIRSLWLGIRKKSISRAGTEAGQNIGRKVRGESGKYFRKEFGRWRHISVLKRSIFDNRRHGVLSLWKTA